MKGKISPLILERLLVNGRVKFFITIMRSNLEVKEDAVKGASISSDLPF